LTLWSAAQTSPHEQIAWQDNKTGWEVTVYISEIYASGFRCYGPSAPLQLKLSSGLNIIVGPNDAGKSAIIDAARYVLWTLGDDYIRPDEQTSTSASTARGVATSSCDALSTI
jgi:recombinational DNA repair ATPase RecF